jgi:hypothetical protein
MSNYTDGRTENQVFVLEPEESLIKKMEAAGFTARVEGPDKPEGPPRLWITGFPEGCCDGRMATALGVDWRKVCKGDGMCLPLDPFVVQGLQETLKYKPWTKGLAAPGPNGTATGTAAQATPTQPAAEALRDQWWNASRRLASFFKERYVVRTDAYGKYTEAGKSFCCHERLTDQVLQWHLGGSVGGTAIGTVIGTYTTAPDNTSKVTRIDIDRHGEDGDPVVNEQYAKALYDQCRGLKLHPLLMDSNGKGGFHLDLLWARPVPAALARSFGRWLTREAEGLQVDQPEVFPKQDRLTEEHPFGNFFRLPGQHHKRPDHYTKVWNGDRWLEGREAIEKILRCPTSNPDLIPEAARSYKAPKNCGGAATDSRPPISAEQEAFFKDLTDAGFTVNLEPADPREKDGPRWLRITGFPAGYSSGLMADAGLKNSRVCTDPRCPYLAAPLDSHTISVVQGLLRQKPWLRHAAEANGRAGPAPDSHVESNGQPKGTATATDGEQAAESGNGQAAPGQGGGSRRSQLKIVARLWNMGYNLIPVHGKRPPAVRWARYQTQRITPQDLEKWYHEFSRPGQVPNWGLLTGLKPYTDAPAVVVLDTDDQEAEDLLLSRCPDSPAKVRSGRGGNAMHRYYRRPDDVAYIPCRSKTQFGGKLYDLDVRADAGYVLIPGSIHPTTGAVYKELAPLTPELIASLPVYDPAWLPDERQPGQDSRRPVPRAARTTMTTSRTMTSWRSTSRTSRFPWTTGGGRRRLTSTKCPARPRVRAPTETATP